jgi:predicted DNA-binding transcriptional regulator AlpA
MEPNQDEKGARRPARTLPAQMVADPALAARLEDGEGSCGGASERGGASVETDGAIGLADRASCAVDEDQMRAMRMWYVTRFKLTSAFLGVSQLATILGMASSTIYTLMRAGRFFLPYRMMNASPRVWIDDLVAWHLSEVGAAQAFGQKPSRRRAASVVADAAGADAGSRALSRAQVDAAVSKAADDALRAAGIDPLARRRRGSR